MLRVPKRALPEGSAERHAALRDYFCDKDATIIDCGDEWVLELAWPPSPERHVDPRLAAALRWWGGGLDYGGMALARRRSGRILQCLYDSWTLHSWSEWLARNNAVTSEDLVVLHVDDHRDLGSPRLAVHNNAFEDLITGAGVVLAEPASIEGAIRSGAIGMGSFLTPFVHALCGVQVRHLCQAPKCTRTEDFYFDRVSQADSLLNPSAMRPAIRLQPRGARSSPAEYRITSSIPDWLDGLEQRRVLLHVDMDYFSNRYDGDSDWSHFRDARLDPPLEAILEQIDTLTQALGRGGFVERIEDIVIAFSPGFFPAEFWQPASERLLAGLGEPIGTVA